MLKPLTVCLNLLLSAPTTGKQIRCERWTLYDVEYSHVCVTSSEKETKKKYKVYYQRTETPHVSDLDHFLHYSLQRLQLFSACTHGFNFLCFPRLNTIKKTKVRWSEQTKTKMHIKYSSLHIGWYIHTVPILPIRLFDWLPGGFSALFLTHFLQL